MNVILPIVPPALRLEPRIAPNAIFVETAFTAIRIEGGLLPAEFLQRVAALSAPGQAAVDYGVPPGRTLRDEIGRYWTIAEALWKDYQQNRPRADIPAERTGVERWLFRLLRDVFGYGDIAVSVTRVRVGDRSFPITHRVHGSAVPLLLTVADRDLDGSHAAFGEDGRRRPPYAVTQEYLNADAASLWGIVANGTHLRLLRDNHSLTRPVYIEGDLERIFEEGLYSDFATLWLIAHASRLAPGADGMADCWMERWRAEGAKTGQRALEKLRAGVTEALRELGSGYVEHTENNALRVALRDKTLTAEGLHQQLLRLVYRLLFLFTTEERDLLHTPEATPEARAFYAQGYALARLRDRSRLKRHYDRHADLWTGLTVTFRALSCGTWLLGLPALGGLFDEAQCPDLDTAGLPNARLLAAIHALAFFTDAGSLQRVNYRDMGTEELGSVYESLLELHPVVRVESRPWTFGFTCDDIGGARKGSERKLSGSYYTPNLLVQEALRTSLDPLIARTLRDNPSDPRNALLRLRVLDPACGSGHFLLGAARRLAAEVSRLDSEGDLPDEVLRRRALREVVRRCIYGVDRNPLAVELCRTALWIESLEPGKPLSFLDAHICCGDALVGVTDLRVLEEGIPQEAFAPFIGDDPAAANVLKRMNKAQRECRPPSLNLGISLPPDLASALDALSQDDENSVDAVARKRLRLEELRSGGTGWHIRVACNLWTSAFFAIKTTPEINGRELCATTEAIWRYLNATAIYGPLLAEVDRLAQLYKFFHWPLEFPEVARNGGFDLITGNPPWETTSPDAKEFFAAYDPLVRFMSNNEQKIAYERLKQHPGILVVWNDYCRRLYTQTNFYKESGRYRMFAPGNLGKGDFNVYRMFVETALDEVRPSGYVAQLVPEGFYNGANAAAIRTNIFTEFQLERLLGFENSRGVWFPSVHTAAKFCLYTAKKGGATEEFQAAFRVNSERRLVEIAEGHTLTVPVTMVREFSLDALAVMEFGAQSEIDVCRKMYSRYPKFGEQISGVPTRIYMREVDMGTDRGLFTEETDGLPVFEGRMVDLYDYRAKGYGAGRGRAADWPDLCFGDPGKAIVPQWRIPVACVAVKLLDRINRYRIGFCDVASPTNERSLVAALIPSNAICGHKVPTILLTGDEPADKLLWLGVANSMTMDFLVRKKVALTMSYTIMDTLPFPREWRETPGAMAIIARVYALSAVGPDMEEFRDSVPGTSGVSQWVEPTEDLEIRACLMAEIEVLVAREVYGLTRDDLRYILDPDNLLGEGSGIETFKALRNREIRTYGEYRTARLVLAAWDRMTTDDTFRSSISQAA